MRLGKLQQLMCFAGLLFVVGCGRLSDLRSPTLKKTTSLESDQRALDIVDKVITAYGGFEKWKAVKKTELVYQDTWPGIIGAVYNPWPKSPQLISQEFWNGTFDSKLTFLEGAWERQSWQRSNGQSFRVIDGKTYHSDNFNLEFFPPTFQYLIELPYRLREIPILKYYGDTILNDTHYEMVFGTWGSLEPIEDFDQYILWINRSTSLIEYFQYTVRAWSSGAVGTVNYQDFREVDGIVIPFYQKITRRPGADFVLHEIRIQSAEVSLR